MTQPVDVDPADAYRALADDPSAVLVDVRTRAELVYVGHPDLSGIGKQLAAIEWSPVAGGVDPTFAERLDQLGIASDAPVYFICRSGSRSRSATAVALAAGYQRAYNVAHGFEGPVDGHGHRGTTTGWKSDGLPWRQS